MKTIRSLLVFTLGIFIAGLFGDVPIRVIAIGIAITLAVVQLSYRRTSDEIDTRVGTVLVILLLVILFRYDLSVEVSDPPDFIRSHTDGQTPKVTLSSQFLDRVKSNQRASRDSDIEAWRDKMRERAAQRRD